MQQAHALAVPASVALIVTAYYLYRRRALALQLAVGLLLALTVFNVLKGLDVEEACLTAGCAALLVRQPRRRSRRGTSPARSGSALVRVPLLVGRGVRRVARGRRRSQRPAGDRRPGRSSARRSTCSLWQPGPFGFRDELARTGLAVELISIFAVLHARPGSSSARSPRRATCPTPSCATRPRRSCASTGRDTLSFFKLRGDKHYLFDPTGTRVRRLPGRERRADGLGRSGRRARPRVDDLMRSLVAFAEARSLRIAALGVSRAGRDAVRAGRAAGAVPRRRGDRRHGRLLARGARASGRCASRSRGSRRPGYRVAARPSSARSTTEHARRARAGRRRLARRRRRSAASAWRWTRSATRTARTTLVALRRSTTTGAVGGFLQFVPDVRAGRACRSR